MKKQSFFMDEYPVSNRKNTKEAMKIFFWSALIIAIGELVFYAWFFTRQFGAVFYGMIAMSIIVVWFQHANAKALLEISNEAFIGYSDPMIILTLSMVTMGIMSLVNLIHLYPNVGLWWFGAVIFSFLFPKYPDSDYKREVLNKNEVT